MSRIGMAFVLSSSIRKHQSLANLKFVCGTLEYTRLLSQSPEFRWGEMPIKKQSARTRPLTKSSVYVRIRPLGTTGGHTLGEAGQKTLSSWDETTVTVRDNDRRESPVFKLTGVVPPEVNQEQAYEAMMPGLVQAFHQDSNVIFYAHGQTGSGKTHTMLGEIDSLSSADPVPGWGMFPRVVHNTLCFAEQLTAAGGSALLLGSAVEFYCFGSFDLMTKNKAQVTIDRDASVFGCRSIELKSAGDLKEFITGAYANRVTAKTKMNDASSRSHVCFILTLHQCSPDRMYKKTTFSLVDMAGSERHSKTGGELPQSSGDGFIEAYQNFMNGTPEKTPIGVQGFIVNYELSYLTTEILKAADMHRKGIPFRAAREMSTGASLYFSACCDGRARLGACVTVSPSPQHGFETWFGLKYAAELMKCRAPLVKAKAVDIGKAIEAAEKKAEGAAAAFAKSNPRPTTAKSAVARALCQGQMEHAQANLDCLRRLSVGDPVGGNDCGMEDGVSESGKPCDS